MPQQLATSVVNNFSKGFVTDASGLNFPENACTDIDNCILKLNGSVERRLGFDYEANHTVYTLDRTGKALSSYRWYNAGGDGNTQLYVQQIGATIYFYTSSAATTATPLSGQRLASTVDMSTYLVSGSGFTVADTECHYADGNGYLFIFHPHCEPVVCKYAAGTVTSSALNIQIRDVIGVPESGVAVDNRPSSLTNSHQYNLENQGWSSGTSWSATTSSGLVVSTGLKSFTLGAMTGGAYTDIKVGDAIAIGVNDGADPYYGTLWGWGIVTSPPAGLSNPMVVNITTIRTSDTGLVGHTVAASFFEKTNGGYINNWHDGVGNYPSNADVWFLFKDSSGAFNPAATLANITFGTTPAVKGHYIFSAFNQDRSTVSGVAGFTVVKTNYRPRCGCWFAGRVWYSGVDFAQDASSTNEYYTWTETIYFSKIIEHDTDLGSCYQSNDPTSERLADLEPSDGGTITIQGCGSIYKLFPMQNGLLVFAANGIWFISGSTGLGFTASDAVVSHVASVKALSSSSFVDVQGYPLFWTADGIYSVAPTPNSGFSVDRLTTQTIQDWYNNIPLDSKKYARGSYDPNNHIVQWVYRSTQETSVTNRYEYDRVLALNTQLKGFYKYSFGGTDTVQPQVHDVVYVDSPGGTTGSPAQFKYVCSKYNSPASWDFTFAEEKDTTYTDWVSSSSVDYTSYIMSGYRLRGAGITRFHVPWVMIFSRTNGTTKYSFQTMWDFSSSADSGRWSNPQFVTHNSSLFSNGKRRLRVRGRGVACQFKIASVSGLPFGVLGWSAFDAGESLP